MAVPVKEIKEILDGALNQEELKLVKETEDYIDSVIRDKKSDEVYIDYTYVNFNYHPKLKNQTQSLHSKRKFKMTEELKKRYKNAGWKMRDSNSDDFAPDYLILSF